MQADGGLANAGLEVTERGAKPHTCGRARVARGAHGRVHVALRASPAHLALSARTDHVHGARSRVSLDRLVDRAKARIGDETLRRVCTSATSNRSPSGWAERQPSVPARMSRALVVDARLAAAERAR